MSRPGLGTAPALDHRAISLHPEWTQREDLETGFVLGVSQGQKGGVGLDTMVQRLVQKSVWEIDSKYK